MRDRIGGGAEAQDRIIGWLDTIGHQHGIEIDVVGSRYPIRRRGDQRQQCTINERSLALHAGRRREDADGRTIGAEAA